MNGTKVPPPRGDLRSGITPVQHQVLDVLEHRNATWAMMTLPELVNRADEEATREAPDYIYLAALQLHIAERFAGVRP